MKSRVLDGGANGAADVARGPLPNPELAGAHEYLGRPHLRELANGPLQSRGAVRAIDVLDGDADVPGFASGLPR